MVAATGTLELGRKRSVIHRILLVGVCAALVSACAQTKPPLYRWGNYENQIYLMYTKPGKAEPGEQVTTLSADVEQTIAEGKRVPPGVHAHLGYMEYLIGNQSQAREEFAAERELYPESRVFMNRIIKQLQVSK